jgi:F-type H+-transporting ATPase subunit delta
MARRIDALASVYARSLYELASKAGGRAKIEEVAGELEQVCELARADKRFAEFLASPIIDADRRKDAIRRIFADRVTDLLLRFLLVLSDKGRLGHLEAINDAFDAQVQESFGKVEVDVYTPGPLDASVLGELRGRIQQALRKEPILHNYTEPGMIGGIKLRIGDQLIDGSVATRLRRMRQELLNSSIRLRERSRRIVEE